MNHLNKCWIFFTTINNCLYNIETPLLTVYKSQCLKTTCWMFWHDGHVFIVRRIRSFYLYRNSDKLCKLCRVSAYTRHSKPYISLLNWNARPNTAIFLFYRTELGFIQCVRSWSKVKFTKHTKCRGFLRMKEKAVNKVFKWWPYQRVLDFKRWFVLEDLFKG